MKWRGGVENQEDNIGLGHGFAGFCYAGVGFGFIDGLAEACCINEFDRDAFQETFGDQVAGSAGVAVTMARSCWTKRLKRDDLPTLGRPTISRVKPSRTMRP